MKIKAKKFSEICEEKRKEIEESKVIKNLNNDIVRLKDLTSFYGKVLDELEKMVFTVEEQKEALKKEKKETKVKLMEIRRELVLPLIQSVMLKPAEKSMPAAEKPYKRKLRIRANLSVRKEDIHQ